MSVQRDTVEEDESPSRLSLITDLTLCDGTSVNDDAIAGSDSIGYTVMVGDYSYVAAYVAGFYGDSAKTYMSELRQIADGCGEHRMRPPKLGDEAVGMFDGGDMVTGAYARVFVRKGQVLVAVVVSSTSHSQMEALKLATAMAKRIPGSGR